MRACTTRTLTHCLRSPHPRLHSVRMASTYQDVLSSFSPDKRLHIQYPGVGALHEGQELKTQDAQKTPAVCWDADENEYHTLAMVDPDAPSRDDPKFGQWRHWLVVNIPGSNVNRGDELTPYMGPAPPAGTGHHRYVFVLYRQSDKLATEHLNNEGKGRACFKIESWAQKHNLSRPLAAHYFHSKHA